CIFDKYVKVFSLIEDTCVDKFKFGIEFTPPPIFGNQFFVWKSLLRILVQHLHVGMRRSAVEIVIMLFAVFAVIAFFSGKSKQSLFDNRILFVPECKSNVDQLFTVAYAADTIFSPTISITSGHVV